MAHGLVDLAGNEARAALLTAKLSGSCIPVLYSRLYDNRLFLQPGNIINLPPAPQVIVSQPDREAEVEEEAIPDNPYRGLFAFRPEHAHLFFGRETFTEQLVKAVESRHLVAVLGASGSGKSSVVFAGLVPALRQRPNEQWLFTTFRPGQDPFLGLANALVPLLDPELSKIKQVGEARDLATRLREGRSPLADYLHTIQQAHPDQRLLLIADQFEELYTLCREAEARQQFLEVLLAVVGAVQGSSPRFVLTLRADFLGQALTYRPFADALQEADLKLGPMNRAELTEAVEKPAELQGVRFEEKLVKRILDDVGKEEGGLPLLEFALTELWGHQSERRLTYVAYEAIGGVKGALSRHADKVYGRLSPEDQAQARRVFVQLVNPGAGTEDTRRLAHQTDLAADWTLVARLAGERLIVTNQVQVEPEAGEIPETQNTVEVVHEALIRNWEQLRLWMDADRDFRRWQENLRAMEQAWQESEEDEAALLRGALLAVAEEQLAARAEDLSERDKAFIVASVKRRIAAEAEEEARRQRELEQVQALAEAERKQAAEQARSATKFRRLAYGLAVVIVIAVGAAIFALIQREAARDAAETLADQNEKAQAELNFYQTTDPAERLKELHNLFSRSDTDSRARARSLFLGLPRVDQLALLGVTDQREALAIVGRAILPNLADINGIYYTNQHLTALLESVAEMENVADSSLQTELAGWLAARQAAQAGAYDEALARYDELLQADDQNPALWYERARVRAKLGQTDEALADLARVMELAQAPEYATSGVLPVGPEFATGKQMTKAVQRLILVHPALAAKFEATGVNYPSLPKVEMPEVVTDGKGVPMVRVPVGPFNMGSNASYAGSDEQPVHEVYLDEFYIDQSEVTNGRYRACVDAGACEAPGCVESYQDTNLADHPVVCVSWYQAQSYCEWRGGHLPTEAQWEKAARGDDERTYPWGEEIAGHLARYHNSAAESGKAPVGHYPEGVSPYGVYDMAGNVWEWVADWYDSEYYQNSPTRNPTGPEDDQNISSKVLRGGSSSYGTGSNPRVSLRYNYAPHNQAGLIGFRCVGSAPG